MYLYPLVYFKLVFFSSCVLELEKSVQEVLPVTTTLELRLLGIRIRNDGWVSFRHIDAKRKQSNLEMFDLLGNDGEWGIRYRHI